MLFSTNIFTKATHGNTNWHTFLDIFFQGLPGKIKVIIHECGKISIIVKTLMIFELSDRNVGVHCIALNFCV